MKKRLLYLFGLLVLVCVLTTAASAADIMPIAPEGSGTAEAPYQISSAEELYWFAGLVNGTLTDGTQQNTAAHAVLTADITINKNVLNSDGSLNGTPAYQWTPIGKDDTAIYTGTFDGSGHTVSGLYCNISSEGKTYAGLFGYIGSGGTIKNVKVADSSITASSTVADAYANAGGVCGYSTSGAVITNCSNSGSVTATTTASRATGSPVSIRARAHAGGVCGHLYGAGADVTITGCTNTGSVNATSFIHPSPGVPVETAAFAGGVCGYIYAQSGNTAITNCSSTGSVTATDTYSSANAGGVCGYHQARNGLTATITSCFSTGSVTADGASAQAGGVCGNNQASLSTAAITNCYGTGSVTATGWATYTGGVCGYNNKGTITSCYGTGSVNASGEWAYAGGVCGQNNKGTIISCYGTGSITATSTGTNTCTGGVCGYNDPISGNAGITSCYWLLGEDSPANGIGGGNGSANQVEGKTADQFASGEVAWLLNNGTQTDAPWRQNLGENGDAFPVLDAAHEAVIKVTVRDQTSDPELQTDYYGNGSYAALPVPKPDTAYFNSRDVYVDPASHSFTDREILYLKTAVTVTVVYGNGTPDRVYGFLPVAPDKTFSLPDAPTRPGYTFSGWNDGSTTYQAGASVPITASTTFTAQWTANSYKVQFDANGGSGTMDEQVFTYDREQALTANAFFRPGYTFAGWNTAADGSGTSYGDGAAVRNLTAENGGTITLYARWTAAPSGGGGSTTPSKTPSQQATDRIESAKDGSTVTVNLPANNTNLEQGVFEELSGKDVTLEISLPGGVTWTVNGQNIPQNADLSGLDLGVTMHTSTIPDNVIRSITGATNVIQFSLQHDGEFGFPLTLTVPLGTTNADLWANLYYYNEGSGELEFQSADRIASDGMAEFVFSHASDYAIVIDTESHEPVELPFTDVPEDAWYADAAAYVYKHGLMAGTSDTVFSPDVTTSRAMIATILWRMAGSPVVNYAMNYTDVAQGQWYSEAVRWATSEGVVSGYGDSFGTNDPITREQFATMLWRYAQTQGYDVSIGEDTNILSYTDAADLAEYAIPAIQWAVGAGIITGTGDGSTLSPQGQATRAQAAVMLMRFCEEYVIW
ncbi:S-layer homology domain-containing protein [Flintibacter sp. KGMB00164]|uniref:S-layer homology domain-containing protein n=1 Tax=Flintibacter sp. KGMB00164 TaxID=2610895 RepID=UPI0012475719|nr:S-layer homology domain-containing protein [Flintibacter sp. KGMB00164]